MSGRVVPKPSKGGSDGLAAFAGAGLLVALVIGGIYFVATYWWAILIAVGTTFGGLFVIFFTIEEVKYRRAKAAARAAEGDLTQSAEPDGEPHGAGPHMHGGMR
jgi:hypothetical protein